MKILAAVKKILLNVVIIIGILCAASVVGYVFRHLRLHETNIAIVYMLAVVLTTLFVPGYVYGFFTSVVAAFAFNFLFTEPYYTFSTNASSYAITFVIMTITAFASSSLASHAKISARKAHKREKETKALYTLTDRLINAEDIHDIASIAVEVMSEIICEKTAFLCFDENGFPEETYVQQQSKGKLVRHKLSDSEELQSRIKGVKAGGIAGAEFHEWPVYGQESVLGVVRIPSEQALTLNESKVRLLRSMIESVALAMDRFRSVRERIRSREDAEQERYRSNLLRSISHDLRTPLSGILGATEMLTGMTEKEDKRYDIAKGIEDDARWLYSLVQNVLSLTRIQEGKLVINKQLEAAEEVLGGAVGYMSRRYPDYEIEAEAPDELLMVPMDAKLINQVLINLIDNAVRHTEAPREINLSVRRDKTSNQAVFTVKDTGSGIASADLPHVFQMFYTAQAHPADSKRGIGLGLAICQSIVKAHGGTIVAQNRTDRTGAEFEFALPLEEDKPSV